MPDRNEWDKNRDREQEFDRERGGHRLDNMRTREGRGYESSRWENEGGRNEGEREGRGNFPRYEDKMRDYQQDDYRHERGESSGGSRTADFSQRGDWGRQGSWGTYGNRPSYERREESYGGQQNERNENRGSNEGQRGNYGGGGYGGQYGGGGGQYGGGMGSYSGGLSGIGSHAGRGPKNWQRSDDRIKEDVNERLTEHSQIDATEIDIQVRNGEVTITGQVEDRRMKRMVEDLVEGVSGVKEVHNQLRASQGNLQQATGNAKAGGGQNASTQNASTQTETAQTRK